MASVSEMGWPYVQHRTGKAGFLTVFDERTMAFADYRGNRQYVSAGAASDRDCLFLMDYVRSARLKIYTPVERLTLHADPGFADLVSDPIYKGRAERIFKLRLEAFDWSCPQHVTPRYTEPQIEQALLLVNAYSNWRPKTRYCAHG